MPVKKKVTKRKPVAAKKPAKKTTVSRKTATKTKPVARKTATKTKAKKAPKATAAKKAVALVKKPAPMVNSVYSKTQLLTTVADCSGVSKKEVSAVFDALYDVIE